MKIVHISDLHLTGPHFVTEWGEHVVEHVNSINPEILVITGDLTDDGYPFEYEMVPSYIEKFHTAHKIIVPGNHDARNKGYTIFEELYGTRFPYYENEKVVVIGIDSADPDIDDGHIGRENYPYIQERLTAENKTRILAMHHHLIPIPGTGRERNIPVDSGDVLQLCIDLGVHIVLSGHKHVPWIWKLEDTYFITAGTATSRRLKGRSYPSFNVIEIKEEHAVLRDINVMDGAVKNTVKICEK